MQFLRETTALYLDWKNNLTSHLQCAMTFSQDTNYGDQLKVVHVKFLVWGSTSMYLTRAQRYYKTEWVRGPCVPMSRESECECRLQDSSIGSCSSAMSVVLSGRSLSRRNKITSLTYERVEGNCDSSTGHQNGRNKRPTGSDIWNTYCRQPLPACPEMTERQANAETVSDSSRWRCWASRWHQTIDGKCRARHGQKATEQQTNKKCNANMDVIGIAQISIRDNIA